jgi:F420H(2)-dependent quinone reductase
MHGGVLGGAVGDRGQLVLDALLDAAHDGRAGPCRDRTRDGYRLWLIAQHGMHAGWVRNFEAHPRVRVRLGRRSLTGRAELLPDDDVTVRIRTFARSALGRDHVPGTGEPAGLRADRAGGHVNVTAV